MADPLVTNTETDMLKIRKQAAIRLLQHLKFTVRELQIIDLYLSKLNNFLPKEKEQGARNKQIEDTRHVIFANGELEEALGVTYLNRGELVTHLAKLCTPFDLHPSLNPDSKKPIRLGALFDYNKTQAVFENGYWTVELECTDEALKYVFIPEGTPFLQYLRYNVVAHDGNKPKKHGFFLYNYLENERFKHNEWIVTVDDLRAVLGVEKDHSYDEYGEFNRNVLKKAKDDIESRTDCRFTYKPAKKVNRKIVSLKFTLETKVEVKYVSSGMHQQSMSEIQSEGEKIDPYDLKQEIEIEKMEEIYDEKIAAKYNEQYLEGFFTIQEVVEIMDVLAEVYADPPRDNKIKITDKDGNEKFDREYFEKVKAVEAKRETALRLAYEDLKDRMSPDEVKKNGEVPYPKSYIEQIIRQNKKEKKDSPAARIRKKGNSTFVSLKEREEKNKAYAEMKQEPQQMSLEDLSSTYNPAEDDILKIDM